MTNEKQTKQRLDLLLVTRGLAVSQGEAKALVMAGRVVVDDRRRDKPGERYALDAKVALKGQKVPGGWASRGALKLLGAIEAFAGFAEAIRGADCLDVGASTGGFTDVLLKHGARHVVALDVGYGQLAWRLQSDARVTIMDRTNIRNVVATDLPFRPTVITCDASFTQVATFLSEVRQLMAPGAWLVVLVKPQFELPAVCVGAGGIVREQADRDEALRRVQVAGRSVGFQIAGAVESPLAGSKGNREWLLALRVP